MPELKSRSEVYEFTMDEIKNLIAVDLKVSLAQIQVSPVYGWPDDDSFGSTHSSIAGFSVTVDRS